MDFFAVCTKEGRGKDAPLEVYPDFIVGRSKDFMVRAQSFHAIWDEETGLWSTDEYLVKEKVDAALLAKANELRAAGQDCTVKLLRSHSSNGWTQYKRYLKNASDDSHQLDMKVTFANTEVKKTDYISRRLPYNLAEGDFSAWDQLVGTLYNPEEREKIEWAIGSVISGDSKKIEKFLVFFGAPGTGKSTIMKIIEKLFEGYVAPFDAKSLVASANAFATSAFKSNPLVAIQHDGDLSKVEDNSLLNSIVGHDEILINEKHKPPYRETINSFLFMGTNKPVKITDSKSGLIRRLIDVSPSNKTFEPELYYSLMSKIDFELGAIAAHCLKVYKTRGRSYYKEYIPENMILRTDPFANFVEDHRDIFKREDRITLDRAWEIYKAYTTEVEQDYRLKKYQFRDNLKDYFEDFKDRIQIEGVSYNKLYMGFKGKKFKTPISPDKPREYTLALEEMVSVLDEMYTGFPAQYSKSNGSPAKYWDAEERINSKTGEPFIPKPEEVCTTSLGDLDTTRLHYLKVPEHHIVIDFDLKGDDGKKSLERSKEAASVFPPTYAELSQSGNGVHLHYIYDGDVSELDNVYSEDIEIKVFKGNSSLRRKLSMCNDLSVTTITGGLPFRKEKKKMHQSGTLKSERGLRDLVERTMEGEFHPGTKPAVDFIEHLLKEAYKEGYHYDLSDMRPKIMLFANGSTNQAAYCLKAVARMQWTSAEDIDTESPQEEQLASTGGQEGRVVFFDCEVYPNLFVVCWKYEGSNDCVKMINPTPDEVQKLWKLFKLVGYHNRGYDNHILYGRYLGANNLELYHLSKKLLSKDEDGTYGAAWGISYADVYDFSSDKKSLKKWEIELGLKHMEMDIPWDEPVPDEKVEQVVEYCCNDVIALEAVWKHCQGDFVARQILADMSGLTVNNSTRQHAINIMFGNEKNPQKEFVYTDLSEIFPGYEFSPYKKVDKSTYQGESVGEGGYVYAEPGIHQNVALLDVASMHPTSIIELDLFGPYMPKFKKLVDARLAIKNAVNCWADTKKHPEQEAFLLDAAEVYLDEARALLPGINLSRDNAKSVSNALKLVINSIYGYTCAKFNNPFRDPRNKDNIVAKRGALFMVDLKNAVQEQGFTVAHIKTDSIKIPNATPDIIAFVQEFGSKYGYSFEHEATFEKMCLVNDAVYIAKYEGENGEWTATGAEFKHPYVFKTMFSGEAIDFSDLCETRQVKEGAMYLRFPTKNESFVDHHVGRSGSFVPVKPGEFEGIVGGELLRIKDDKEFAVTGTKDWLWVESEMVRMLRGDSIERMMFERLEDSVEGTGSIADFIDMAYFSNVVEDAAQSIAKFAKDEDDPSDVRMSFDEFMK